ncbi:MAG TPA: SRPBCC family protein [Streptosporangiaceae bacterium]|nr:SRPBCC family protein [Streptosporangiaceae bacterium]
MSKTEITAEPGIPLIVMTRDFDAPCDLVFRAYTEPELLVQWLGPRDLTTTVDRYDVRDGGRWRYVQKDPEGNEHGFHGVFHGEPSPEAIVQTFEYEGMPGHVMLETTTLEERGGTTLARTVASFQSVADRDGMVASGMERGVHEGDERLDELLARLQVG